MKLYNSIGPNPRLVRLFIHEKQKQGEIELVPVDILGGENRQADYKKKNPTGQLPCLELDDGRHIAETVVICEYLEDLWPDPPLIGSNAEEKAEQRMWTRRLEYHITIPMANGFRFSEGLPLFKERMITIPEAAEGLKQIAREKLRWLDGLMNDGREFVAGPNLTLADVLLYCMLAFGNTVGQPYADDLEHIGPWFERLASRPSAEA